GRTPGGASAVGGGGWLGARARIMIRKNKSMGMLLFAQNVLDEPRLLPAAAPSGALPLLSREGVRQSRRGEAGGSGRSWAAQAVALVRDVVLNVSEFASLLLLVVGGAAMGAAAGSPRFLGVLLRVQALLQAAVLVALIWINRSFTLETEVRRLNDLATKRSREATRSE